MKLPWSRTSEERDQEGTAAREAAALQYAGELKRRRALLTLDPEGGTRSLVQQMAGILDRWDLSRGVRR